jgi:anti-sigma B factor antagonist
MRVESKNTGDVVVVDLQGQLVAGTGDQQFNVAINELVAKESKKIVVNLGGVTRLDSSGLGELVAGVQLAERFGTTIRFVKPEGPVQKVLEIAQLLPALDVHETEEEAVAAFR